VYLENPPPTEYTKGRDSEEYVWQVILDDLTDAIECASLPDKYAKDSPDYGRITKGAAYAVRGKVYMWLKKWAEAEADFRKVGECGFSLFQGSYADLFKIQNEKCDEMVFSLGMEEIQNYGNKYSYVYGNWMTAGRGWSSFFMNTDFVETYQWADGRPFSYNDVIPGYSAMSPEARSVYFMRNNMTEEEIVKMTAYGADMSKYNPTDNEARILRAYTGRDPRMNATVIVPYTNYLGGYHPGAAINYQQRSPYRSDLAPSFDMRLRDHENDMLYSIRKFVAVGKEFTNVQFNPLDIPVIRYADVLLSLAETLNEQGKTTDAVALVNQIRKRAGVAELNSGPAHLTVGNQTDMRKRIIDEKHWELACEEQLYSEEMRWGIWKETKFAQSNGLKQCWGTPVYQYSWGGDHMLQWPIPQAEVEKNPNLTQADGW
jgi:tetratricopeptide (TPR) repeat protein